MLSLNEVELKKSRELSCEDCSTRLIPITILFSGPRNLLVLNCVECNVEYYTEIPSHFGLLYEIILTRKNNMFHLIKINNWFGNDLINMFKSPSTESIEVEIKSDRMCDDIVLFNCLDKVYGHSLMKLINVKIYNDYHPEKNIAVIINEPISIFVPKEVKEIILVKISFNKLGQFRYLKLEERLDSYLKSKRHWEMGITIPIPPAKYSSFNFFTTSLIERKYLEKYKNNLNITFLYREDRRWGSFNKLQIRRINKLFRILNNEIFNLKFFIVGFGKKNKFDDQIIDLRVDKFSIQKEIEWINIYNISDLAIGVHGSHLIIPSSLSKQIVILLPKSRFNNIYEDYLFNSEITDNWLNLNRVKVLYGNKSLSDIKVNKLKDVVISSLNNKKRFETLHKLDFLKSNEDYINLKNNFKMLLDYYKTMYN